MKLLNFQKKQKNMLQKLIFSNKNGNFKKKMKLLNFFKNKKNVTYKFNFSNKN